MRRLYNAFCSLAEKWACHHEWTLIKETIVSTDFGGQYTSLNFVCDKCGKFKRVKTNPG